MAVRSVAPGGVDPCARAADRADLPGFQHAQQRLYCLTRLLHKDLHRLLHLLAIMLE